MRGCVIHGLAAAVKGLDMKNKAEAMLNFLLRAVFGMLAVYGINFLLQKAGVAEGVGINPLSFLTTGFLGLPGVALLYGVRFYLLL